MNNWPVYTPPALWYLTGPKKLLWCDECHCWHKFIIECPYISDERKENYRQNMAGLAGL